MHQQSLRTRNRSTSHQTGEQSSVRGLVKGEFGIIDTAKTPTLEAVRDPTAGTLESQLSPPRTYGFYKQNLKVLKALVPLALARLHKIDAALIEKFIQYRLKDEVTPVTINH